MAHLYGPVSRKRSSLPFVPDVVFLTGPSEVTIFLPEAIQAVNGPGSDCTKSAWYDNTLPMRGIIGLRSIAEHDMRRSIWNQAFTPKGGVAANYPRILLPTDNFLALRSYNDKVMKYGNQLEKCFAATSGQPVRVDDWFHFFTFDMMGEFAFGKSFNMLVTEKWQYMVLIMRKFLVLLGPFTPVPWFCRLGFGFPGAAPEWNQFVRYCKDQMDERVQV